MRTKAPLLVALAAVVALVTAPISVSAATNTNLSQLIGPGTFSIGFWDGASPLGSLAASFGATNFSFSCQDTAATIAPTAGTEKITISNPKNANVTMDIAGTASDLWTGDQTPTPTTYDYQGADCDTGYLEVGNAVTVTKTAGKNNPTVTKNGGSFANGNTSVNIFQTSNAKAWEGDIKNIDLTQHIPAETDAGTYTLPLTLTSTDI